MGEHGRQWFINYVIWDFVCIYAPTVSFLVSLAARELEWRNPGAVAGIRSKTGSATLRVGEAWPCRAWRLTSGGIHKSGEACCAGL
jgi:hypothetical protein